MVYGPFVYMASFLCIAGTVGGCLFGYWGARTLQSPPRCVLSRPALPVVKAQSSDDKAFRHCVSLCQRSGLWRTQRTAAGDKAPVQMAQSAQNELDGIRLKGTVVSSTPGMSCAVLIWRGTQQLVWENEVFHGHVLEQVSRCFVVLGGQAKTPVCLAMRQENAGNSQLALVPEAQDRASTIPAACSAQGQTCTPPRSHWQGAEHD